jgi:hypothetical protein
MDEFVDVVLGLVASVGLTVSREGRNRAVVSHPPSVAFSLTFVWSFGACTVVASPGAGVPEAAASSSRAVRALGASMGVAPDAVCAIVRSVHQRDKFFHEFRGRVLAHLVPALKSTTPCLEALTDGNLRLVASFLCGPDVARVGACSIRLRRALHSEGVWEALYARDVHSPWLASLTVERANERLVERLAALELPRTTTPGKFRTAFANWWTYSHRPPREPEIPAVFPLYEPQPTWFFPQRSVPAPDPFGLPRPGSRPDIWLPPTG